MNVGRRITSRVITVTPDLPVTDALALMRREKIRHTPVVVKNKLVGIVTENDLLNANPSKATSLSVWEINYLLNKITVADVMTKKVITTTEDTPIEEAARIMADKKISCLPVLRDGDIAGIITESDLLWLFTELLGARHKGIRMTVQVTNEPGTIAKISQAIFQAGGNIIAFGSFAGDTISQALFTLKVEGVETKALKKLIEPLVIRVVDMRTL